MSKKRYLSSDDLLALEQHMTEQRRERLRTVARNRQRGMMVIMEDVHNPHNLAAIARSADAFGIHDMTFTLENHKRFDPQRLGMVSSRSASKWLDYRIFEDGTRHCLNTLRSEGWHILATVIGDDVPSLYDVDYTQYDQLAVMVGNEHAGISPTALELADSSITIPMYGMIQSLNVSVATAILLAEISRQRRAQPERFLVDADEANAIALEFLRRQHQPDHEDENGESE